MKISIKETTQDAKKKIIKFLIEVELLGAP
jgi:hypothetical protein